MKAIILAALTIIVIVFNSLFFLIGCIFVSPERTISKFQDLTSFIFEPVIDTILD